MGREEFEKTLKQKIGQTIRDLDSFREASFYLDEDVDASEISDSRRHFGLDYLRKMVELHTYAKLYNELFNDPKIKGVEDEAQKGVEGMQEDLASRLAD